MKRIALLGASVLATVLVGCQTTPRHTTSLEPNLRVDPSRRTIMVGESTHLVAHSRDLAGSGDVKWTVSPAVGRITTDSRPGSTAMFTADQPGAYVIKATVQRPDGTWVTSRDISITVNGPVMATER
ncbi:MAG: hypothetical protein FWD61_18565 [Phycisphaerales bacterium]|nr:hypothetical protein [Phycisphaerales bacterium]